MTARALARSAWPPGLNRSAGAATPVGIAAAFAFAPVVAAFATSAACAPRAATEAGAVSGGAEACATATSPMRKEREKGEGRVEGGRKGRCLKSKQSRRIELVSSCLRLRVEFFFHSFFPPAPPPKKKTPLGDLPWRLSPPPLPPPSSAGRAVLSPFPLPRRSGRSPRRQQRRRKAPPVPLPPLPPPPPPPLLLLPGALPRGLSPSSRASPPSAPTSFLLAWRGEQGAGGPGLPPRSDEERRGARTTFPLSILFLEKMGFFV